MFQSEPDQRLSIWSQFRNELETSEHALQDVAEFWHRAPSVPYNKDIDQYYPASWPTPWEIIFENRYDDFTKSLMMGWTLLLTERFKDCQICIKILVDDTDKRLYNVLSVDDNLVLNFKDNEVVESDKIPSLYRLENIVPLKRPR